MKSLLLYILLAVIPPVWGKLRVVEQSGSVFLEGASCDELVAEAEALKQWSIKLGETPGTVLCVPKGNSFSVKLDGIAPPIVLEGHQQSYTCSGPNCWNTALRAAGIIPGIRLVESDELAFWLDQDLLCKSVPKGEDLRPGDIVRLRDKRSDFPYDIHAFTYVSDQLSFNKNGPDKSDIVELADTSTVLSKWGLSPKCLDQRSGEDCSYLVEVRRCRSFEEYSADSQSWQKQFKLIHQQLLDLECLQSNLLSAKNLDILGFAKLWKLSEEILPAIEGLPSGSNSEAIRFETQSLKLRYQALKDQVTGDLNRYYLQLQQGQLRKNSAEAKWAAQYGLSQIEQLMNGQLDQGQLKSLKSLTLQYLLGPIGKVAASERQKKRVEQIQREISRKLDLRTKNQ